MPVSVCENTWFSLSKHDMCSKNNGIVFPDFNDIDLGCCFRGEVTIRVAPGNEMSFFCRFIIWYVIYIIYIWA